MHNLSHSSPFEAPPSDTGGSAGSMPMSLADKVERAIREALNGSRRIDDLRVVEEADGAVTVTGHTDVYYTRQLAQSAALTLLKGTGHTLHDHIEVTKPAS
ncbi:MAG: BON domain-containing protein [Candidatus Peribacteraceae bacterium]|nr:BON domain-containing protein [Candidatus Peribacteraceae bacterium]